MSRIRIIFLLLEFYHFAEFATAIECIETREASIQLESYYTWWYRLWNIFNPTNPLCSLDDENRKELCAEVVKACFTPVSDKMKKEEIIEAMDTPTNCEKHIFKTPLVDYEGTWSRRKRMFICSGFTVEDEPVAEFYLSAAGLKNAVLIFQAPDDDPELIQVIRMVTGLSYEEEKTKEKEVANEKDASEASKKDGEDTKKI